MDGLTDPIIQTLIMSLVSGILGWVGSTLKTKSTSLKEETAKEEEERTLNRKVIGEVLFFMLEDMHDRYVVNGEPCSVSAKERVDSIYRYYHDDLGLNGPGTYMYNEIMNTRQSKQGGDSK